MTRTRSSTEPPRPDIRSTSAPPPGAPSADTSPPGASPIGAPPSLRRPPAPRGACPSLVTPMPTGDGLIARLLPADGVLTTAALAAFAAAARTFGNGLVEVTQRGSLQVRGIRADTVEALERTAQSVGAMPPPGPPAHVGPLAGLDPTETADPRPLAAALRARLDATAEALPPKFAVLVDGGGAWPLDGLSADLRLTAVATADGPMWRLESDFAAISPPLPAAAAVEAARTFVSHVRRSERRRPAPRVPRPPIGVLLAAMVPSTGFPGTALGGDGSAIPHDAVGSAATAAPVAAAGIALPFGVTNADQLGALVAAAESGGADEVRLAPGHGLVFVGSRRGPPALSSGRAAEPDFNPAVFLVAAAHLGFVTRPDDPRLALSVCAGAPACGSGEAPTRPLAEAVVAAGASLIAAGGEVHLSGCAKGCARASAADLTIVGREGGYALAEGGTAADAAGEVVPATRLLVAVAAISRRLAAERRTRDSGAPPGSVG
jgi:precorrin-3B synthase